MSEADKVVLGGVISPVPVSKFLVDGRYYRMVATFTPRAVGGGAPAGTLVAIEHTSCSYPFSAGSAGFLRGRYIQSAKYGAVFLADQETEYERRVRHRERRR